MRQSLRQPMRHPLRPVADATRWRYALDGINDYIAGLAVPLLPGDALSFSFVAPTTDQGEFRTLLSSISSDFSDRLRIRKDRNGTFSIGGCDTDFLLDGQPARNGDPFPLDGQVHTVVLTVTTAVQLDFIGKTTGESIMLLSHMPVFDVAVADRHFYPINEGPGATQIFDTLGGHHGTPHNFNDANWQQAASLNARS